jgi:hypothetical protein
MTNLLVDGVDDIGGSGVAQVSPDCLGDGTMIARFERNIKQYVGSRSVQLMTMPLRRPGIIAMATWRKAHLCLPSSYRYALSRGRRGLRVKYDVDLEARKITVYDFGPRGDVYRA